MRLKKKDFIINDIFQNNPQMTLCSGSCERVFEATNKSIPGKVECELCNLKFW